MLITIKLIKTKAKGFEKNVRLRKDISIIIGKGINGNKSLKHKSVTIDNIVKNAKPRSGKPDA